MRTKRSGGVADVAVEAVIAKLAVERRAANAERPGHLRHASAVALEGKLDQLALERLEGPHIAAGIEESVWNCLPRFHLCLWSCGFVVFWCCWFGLVACLLV